MSASGHPPTRSTASIASYSGQESKPAEFTLRDSWRCRAPEWPAGTRPEVSRKASDRRRSQRAKPPSTSRVPSRVSRARDLANRCPPTRRRTPTGSLRRSHRQHLREPSSAGVVLDEALPASNNLRNRTPSQQPDRIHPVRTPRPSLSARAHEKRTFPPAEPWRIRWATSGFARSVRRLAHESNDHANAETNHLSSAPAAGGFRPGICGRGHFEATRRSEERTERDRDLLRGLPRL